MIDRRRAWAAPGRTGGNGERGAVTAEFAVALPAVVLVLVAVLLIAMAGTTQLRVADAARAGARAAAAGENDGRVAEIVRHIGGEDLTVSVLRADPWVTVQVRAPVAGGWFSGGLTATGEATAWLESAIAPVQGGGG
ncbi:TadE-like protein [Sanguibacter gelidistatuariae]|uniref:TadE-like protein n=1 Tax=Sanguibacter gelidistatuariae TaxID=1814289 RepID=A0A1G6HKQ4_9MICO|nr:TadE family type IV pilus minor pilin [Sanguibacter gelidistatuariae]SDB94819.1 TadE-like protein [Sanguibacter gelidistatuariae]